MAINTYELVQRRVLVTRGSARSIQGPLSSSIRDGGGKAELDFSGVNGITPSFFDELLSIIDESWSDLPGSELRVIIKAPPTDVSPMLKAVAKVHRLKIEQVDSGAWVISSPAEAA